MFGNLLVNGAHAIDGRDTIRVSLSASDDTCQVVFRDVDPAFPLTSEKIVNPVLHDTVARIRPGTADARRLIEAHHGTISISCPRPEAPGRAHNLSRILALHPVTDDETCRPAGRVAERRASQPAWSERKTRRGLPLETQPRVCQRQSS